MNNIENKDAIYLVDVHGEKLTVKKKVDEDEDLKGDENIEEIIDAIKHLKILFKLNTWKGFFEWSKENMSTVLIWISGIGALIQIRELARIHISYIRFFSVTQLISDGALVLLIATFIVVLAFLTTKFLTPKLVTRQIRINIKKERSFSTFEKYVRYFSTFLGSALCVVTFMGIGAADIQKNTVTYMILIACMYAFLTYTGFYYTAFDEYLEKTKDKIILFGRYDLKSLYRSFNTFMVIATVMVIGIIIFKSLFLFTSALRLPYNLENYNKLTERIEEDHKGLSYYKLRYFNDTYTFVEIRKDKALESNIVIYKTDDLIF